MGIISQFIRTSKHHIVLLKYTQFLLVNYTLSKAGKKKVYFCDNCLLFQESCVRSWINQESCCTKKTGKAFSRTAFRLWRAGIGLGQDGLEVSLPCLLWELSASAPSLSTTHSLGITSLCLTFPCKGGWGRGRLGKSLSCCFKHPTQLMGSSSWCPERQMEILHHFFLWSNWFWHPLPSLDTILHPKRLSNE